jgi:hypothetical protein
MSWHSERKAWNDQDMCARKACKRSMGEYRWWNKGSELYYCSRCAHLINEANPDLCVPAPAPILKWDTLEKSLHDLVFEAYVEAGELFIKKVGGSTRHYVYECLQPALERRGILILDTKKMTRIFRQLDRIEGADRMESDDYVTRLLMPAIEVELEAHEVRESVRKCPASTS